MSKAKELQSIQEVYNDYLKAPPKKEEQQKTAPTSIWAQPVLKSTTYRRPKAKLRLSPKITKKEMF